MKLIALILVVMPACVGTVVDEPAAPAESGAAISTPRTPVAPAPSSEPCCSPFTCAKSVVEDCSTCPEGAPGSCCVLVTGAPCATL